MAGDAIASRMPELVKGAGFARPGGNKPLTDDAVIFDQAFRAEKALRASVAKSHSPGGREAVYKGLNPGFASEFGLFLQDSPMSGGMGSFVDQLNATLSAELGKNITLTSPLSTGLVPYDLVAPSRLIYPVYSPLRNKIPRTQGMGTSRRVKAITAISGSHTGQAIKRISIPELVQAGGGLGANQWPNNLPGSGAQTANDVNIPYKFFGLSEALSWLSQFAGQGFEDVAALANLILLQEMMMGEEFQILSGTGTAVPAPGTVTLTKRTAGATETNLSGVTTNIYVRVTALNLYGETVTATVQTTAPSSQVVDVTIPASPGATFYNIYVGTGTADPGVAGSYLMATNVGGSKYTLQGAIPTSGTTPPTADTGTSSSNDYEGVFSILSGHAATATVYPTGWQGGYYNGGVGAKLSYAVVATALQHLWDGTSTAMEGFRANPVELVCEGGDAKRLADDVIASGATNTAYRISINEGADQAGIRVGAAVSEIQNPITRDVVRVLVHPWFPQGTATLNSYTTPQAFSNVGNIWENVMVQDYLSINWPVIDASYRYSIFYYGSLVCYAPMYNGLLQGLQVSDVTPYS